MKFEIPLINNAYYKDNVFHIYQIDENTAKVEYYSDRDIDAYISYFDADGKPIDFEKAILEGTESFTKAECSNDDAASCLLSIGEPTATKLNLYIEGLEGEGNTAEISYCANSTTDLYITYFDAFGEAVDFKKVTLPVSEEFTKVTHTGNKNATSYVACLGEPTAEKLGFYMGTAVSGDGRLAEIEYCSDKDTQAYISYFDTFGNAIGSEKVLLTASEKLTKAECEGNSAAATYKIAIGTPTAAKLGFYMEEESTGSGNEVSINYCSDKNINMYISFFDASGNPIDFSKVTLDTSETLTNQVYESKKAAATYKVAIGTPTAEKLGFYMEESVENGTVTINYCADEARRVFVAFYDDENIMRDVKARRFEESSEMKTVNYSCSKATNYKLFIWDGVTPLYEAKGTLK